MKITKLNQEFPYTKIDSVTTKHLRAIQTFTIHFVLLPVGHLTSSIAVPDALTGRAAKRLVGFEATGAVVVRLLQCGGGGVGCFLGNYSERNKKILFLLFS